MKSLVIYYSFEGDTKLIGDAIADEIGADILELRPVVEISSKDYMKNYLGEKLVLMKTAPLLKPYDIKLEEYDLLIFGTPIWSGTYAPALRSFFTDNKIEGKKIGLYYCFTVKAGLISKHLREALTGNEIINEIGFIDPLKKDKEKSVLKAKKWGKFLLETIQ